MEKLSKTELQKALYKTKPTAYLSYIVKGIALYYTTVDNQFYHFEVPVTDTGDANFEVEMEAKLLIRWYSENPAIAGITPSGDYDLIHFSKGIISYLDSDSDDVITVDASKNPAMFLTRMSKESIKSADAFDFFAVKTEKVASEVRVEIIDASNPNPNSDVLSVVGTFYAVSLGSIAVLGLLIGLIFGS